MKIVAIALLTTIVHSSLLAQEKIEWNDVRTLVSTDFKRAAPAPSSRQSVILRLGIETDFKDVDITSLKTFNKQVSAYFYPYDSWISSPDELSLRHIRALFDLDEWMARLVRKKFDENRAIVLNGEHNRLYTEVQVAFQLIKDQYNAETQGGDDLVEQLKWEGRIAEALSSLADFCKQCEPKK